jgi:predicted nucleotidyltransferase
MCSTLCSRKNLRPRRLRRTRQEIKTASEFAQAINWFTQEIETLRQQYHALEQDHQKLAARPADTDEVAALKGAQCAARGPQYRTGS